MSTFANEKEAHLHYEKLRPLKPHYPVIKTQKKTHI
jgi:hypothetical protein